MNNDTIISRAKRIAADRTKLLSRQRAEQEKLFGGLQRRIGGQERLGGAFKRFQEEAGITRGRQAVSAVQGQIFDVESLLDRLKGDIGERTKGTFTTEAQARRQEAAEGGELRTQLGRLGSGLDPLLESQRFGQEDVRTQLDLLQAQQRKELTPIETRINAISDRFAREITGYNRGKESELDALISKVNRQQALDDQERARLQSLASQERAFQQSRDAEARAAADRAALFQQQTGGGGDTGRSSTLNNLLFGLGGGGGGAGGLTFLQPRSPQGTTFLGSPRQTLANSPTF